MQGGVVFPNGAVVMWPPHLVSGDDVGVESQRYLRRNYNNSLGMHTCPVTGSTWWMCFDRTGVANIYFSHKGEDALDIVTRQIKARRLDASCGVACTSCNFESSDDEDRDGVEGDLRHCWLNISSHSL